MRKIPTDFSELVLLEPKVWIDARGSFQEAFNKRVYADFLGDDVIFVQDNLSHSRQGVLRGLHYQAAPFAQGKLIYVIQGEIWDVVVDIRKSSPNFGKWTSHHLSAENARQLWIPPGFAHGFLVLSATADVMYKTTAYYAPQSDRGMAWNDADIGIQWPDLGVDFLLSEKDQKQPAFKNAEVFAA